MIGFDVDDDVPTDHRGRPIPPGHRPSRVRGVLAAVVALAVLVGGGAAAYVGIHHLARGVSTQAAAPADFTGEGSGTASVVVAAGATVTDIAAGLVTAGVIASAAPFIATADTTTGGTTIQPGTYRLHSKMSSAAALALLLNPSSRIGSATVVPEGQRLSVTLAAISRTTRIPLAQLTAAAADPAALGVPSWGRSTEGFLFPATYQFAPRSSATAVLSTMVTRFAAAATATGLEAAAKSLGRSPYQVLTVASLVQAEVPDAADQARVARVLYNRLARGMPLQLDSTVKYVVGGNGSVFTTTAQRGQPSPYNTYLHAGLPPGPIDSPGQQALMAALHPSAGPWLYYVTVNLATGRTVYSTTLAGHQAAVAQLQTWCAANSGRC